jgi:peroxiredoxin (alkyl hydroperoxide reductase subunit C)
MDPMPRLHTFAPQFQFAAAATTAGRDVGLQDYRGRWVVLFSLVAAHTSVCSTELVAFVDRSSAFAKREVELLAVSADSVYAQLLWLQQIERLGRKVEFPLLADSERILANMYGMMHGERSDVMARCTFVIDPGQTIRAVSVYPISVGRNVDEILRLVDALQYGDERKMATPANWTGGKGVAPLTPVTPGVFEFPIAPIEAK